MAKKRASSQPQVVNSQQPRLYFPHIFRKIPAKNLWRWLIVLTIVSILLLQLVGLVRTLYQSYNAAQLKQAEKQVLEQQLLEWEKIAKQRPNYRDAYFQLAILSYRLNKLTDVKMYLEKVFLLDPNFGPARELEKRLKGDY